MMADDMMSDWMDVDPAHMGMDMMYMDMGLMAETTYYYRVAAMNSVGMGDYSDGMAMAMTMAENMAPMAGDDVADQMVYVGAMVEVQSNFSDPDEDMLSYMASSDMMDVATATVDDMGMVTITGVAEGMATITVTASDPDGHVRHADHHGHRHDDAAHGVGRSVHHQRDERRRRHGHGHADARRQCHQALGLGSAYRRQ